MQQSVIYQEWKEEFLQEGREEGRQEGRQEGEQTGALREAQSLILRQLNRSIGDVSPELRSQIQTLSLDQLEALGEALLDFTEPAELVNWLQEHQAN